MTSSTRRCPGKPSRSAMDGLFLVLMLLCGGLLVPVIPAPSALAESVWTSSSYDDFNGTGSWLSNCELNGTGDDARVVLKSAPDWVQKNPPKSPAARAYGGMAAIDTDDKTVIFGGTDYTGDQGDTWVYDLEDNRWTDMAPAEAAPGRQYCQLATVYGTDKAVLFGGFYYYQDWYPVTLNDTWVYDLGDNAWVNVTPAVSPPTRAVCSMATVFGTDTVVLFSGLRDLYSYEMVRDTWTYDVSDNLWTQRRPSSSPSGRYGAGMAAVWNDDKVVLFGGYNDTTGVLGDTWVYDLSDDQWYQKSPAKAPSNRALSALATRYDDDKILLFGGNWDDTHIYDLSDDLWTLQTPAHKPSGRSGQGMATVARTDKTVVFGGESASMSQETWVWDPNAHFRSGEFRSPQRDLGGLACIMMLNWTATLPDQTSIKFQVRTADNEYNLTWRNFTGPDGSTTSYYVGESAIWTTPGDSWVQYRAILSTGNTSVTPALEEVRIFFDRFPSVPVILGPPDGGWLNTTSPVFRWQFNDTDTEAQGMFDWQLSRTGDFSSIAFRSGEVGAAETDYIHDRPLPEGLWYWRVRTADTHGWGPFSEPRAVGVDISPPSSFSPFVDPAKWSAGAIDLMFLTDDNESGVQNYTVFIDNKDYGVHESPWTLPELPDGTRTIVVRATDRAGNWAEGKVKAFVDRTPPADVSPVAEPPSWTRTPPQITFSTKDNSSGVDHYEVRVDKGRFLVSTSPFTAPELDDGEHDITVRAVDRAGNSVEGSVRIYIDRSKPDPLGVGVEPPGWTAQDQTITFWTQDGTSEIDRYEVSLDGSAFVRRESPFCLTGMKDGTHTVTVRAFDLGGNFIEGQAQAFTDRSPPEELSVTVAPAGWTRQAPVVTFVAYDNISATLSYRAMVDNGTFSKVKSPWSPGELGDGAHIVTVRATDEAGNSVVESAPVLIDNSPPAKVVLAINNGSASTSSRHVWLTVSAEDAGSGPGQMCFSDDGLAYTRWEPFAPGREWTIPSGSGGKAVYFKVQDALGNEARPVSATINYAEPVKADTTTPLMIGAVVAIVAAALASYAVFRLRKRKAQPAGPQALPGATAQPPPAKPGANPPTAPAKPGAGAQPPVAQPSGGARPPPATPGADAQHPVAEPGTNHPTPPSKPPAS